MMSIIFIMFFFSSRRRHTRYIGDWSSDVCSSDLEAGDRGRSPRERKKPSCCLTVTFMKPDQISHDSHTRSLTRSRDRSEERRVGKECRSGVERDNKKKTSAITGVDMGERWRDERE